MIQRIETRELFTLECGGAVLQGTYHMPSNHPEGASRPGILLLAGFPMPRAAHGDSAVSWANGLAAAGYPCFRIDMPGVGDSFGAVPPELLEYTNAGGYERVAAAALSQLVERYHLAGMVMLGQCAGAISAIFAAAIAPQCRGLILLDPPFNLAPAARPSVKRALFFWSTRSRVGGLLISLNDRLRSLRHRVRRNITPENANHPLLKRWKTVASGGLPILMLNVPEPKTTVKSREGRFDYVAHVLKLAGSRSRVEVRNIEEANHSFSNPPGKAAVPAHSAQWMSALFPVQDVKPAPENNEVVFVRQPAILRG